ncbi:MAG: hypothetical protein ABEJ28_12405 [Salinigranum sp.]
MGCLKRGSETKYDRVVDVSTGQKVGGYCSDCEEGAFGTFLDSGGSTNAKGVSCAVDGPGSPFTSTG